MTKQLLQKKTVKGHIHKINLWLSCFCHGIYKHFIFPGSFASQGESDIHPRSLIMKIDCTGPVSHCSTFFTFTRFLPDVTIECNWKWMKNDKFEQAQI